MPTAKNNGVAPDAIEPKEGAMLIEARKVLASKLRTLLPSTPPRQVRDDPEEPVLAAAHIPAGDDDVDPVPTGVCCPSCQVRLPAPRTHPWPL